MARDRGARVPRETIKACRELSPLKVSPVSPEVLQGALEEYQDPKAVYKGGSKAPEPPKDRQLHPAPLRVELRVELRVQLRVELRVQLREPARED